VSGIYLKEIQDVPKYPTVTSWDHFKFWAYNFFRKPLVIIKKKKIEELVREVIADLNIQVLPQLKMFGITCDECRNLHAALEPQIFLSSIQSILTKMKCSEHGHIFDDFHKRYRHKFDDSENLARWINGFS